jgi:hypothetical protein
MNLVKLLGLAKNAGRVALAVGGAGSVATWGAGDLIELVANLTALVGAISEAVVRIIAAKAKASGKIPLDAVI